MDIETDAAVDEILVHGGKATGVRLHDGRIITGRAVAANVNPRLLFLDLLDSGNVDPAFRRRMALGHADYRMPIKGLYLCGSGAHPGGGVTGIPGHNAAREIIRDIG